MLRLPKRIKHIATHAYKGRAYMQTTVDVVMTGGVTFRVNLVWRGTWVPRISWHGYMTNGWSDEQIAARYDAT